MKTSTKASLRGLGHWRRFTVITTIDVRKGLSRKKQLNSVSRFFFSDADMDMALDNIVPESLNWRHTDEGPE